MTKWLERIFSSKFATPTTTVRFSEASDPLRSTSDYKGFATDGYGKNVIAYACINKIASGAASIPFELYKKSATGKRKEITDHPLLTLLRKPNPGSTQTRFTAEWTSYLAMTGNSYQIAIGPRPGQPPRELWILRPDQMTPVPGPNGLVLRYEYRPGNAVTNYDVNPTTGASPINHMKTFNPRSHLVGQSPLEAGAMSVDSLNAMTLWNLSLTQNHAKPSLAIMVKGQLNEVQRETFKKSVTEQYEGPWRAGKPMVLGADAEVKQLSWSPIDMDFLNSKKTSEKDVALAFNVPDMLVGIHEGRTYSNLEEALMDFYSNTVIPIRRWQCEEYNNWLVPAFNDASIELDINEEKIEALEPKREKRWTRAQNASWLSINEKRELTGYGQWEQSDNAGDQILVATALIPLETAASMPEGSPTNDVTGDYAGAAGQEPPPEGNKNAEKKSEDRGTVFNLSKYGAERYRDEQDRKKLAMARGFKRRLLKVFEDERDRVAEKIGKVQRSLIEFTLNQELEKSRPALKRVLKAEIYEVCKVFGAEVFDAAKSVSTLIETKDSRDRFDFSIERYAEVRVDDLVGKLSATTRKRVLKKLKEAIEESTNEDGIADAIDLGQTVKDIYDSYIDGRADNISRTEVHIAAEESKRSAASSLQIPGLMKQWISVNDERTRDAHADMDSTTLDFDEKFQVANGKGSDMMDGPGDKDASAENVVNCRCVLTFVTESR